MAKDSELQDMADTLFKASEEGQGDASPPAEEQEPDAQTEPEANAEATEPAEEQTSDDLDEPADKGLDAEFYAQQVPGTDLTYGDFKDRVKELAAVDATRETLENETGELRNQRMALESQVLMLEKAGLLSDEINAQINQHRQNELEFERKLILAGIPEWQDNAVATKDAGEIAESWKAYGLTNNEILLLLQSDSRFAKREYDLLLARRRLASAESKVKQAKKTAQSPTQKVNRSQKQKLSDIEKNASSPEDRQLAALLGGMSNDHS